MLLAYGISGFILFLIGSWLFDDVIEYQQANHLEAWKEDGKPMGFGFKPFGSSYIAMCFVGLRYWKTVPVWAQQDVSAHKKCMRLIKFNRLWLWYCILIIPVAIVAAST